MSKEKFNSKNTGTSKIENGTAFVEKYQNHLIITVIILAFIVFIIYSFQASSWKEGFSILGVSITIAGAAFVAGGLLGFLFGIPKTLQQENDANTIKSGDTKQETTYRHNTNLEDISDWLTKILVGVGLTQIASISGVLNKYADFVAAGLGNFSSSKVFGIAILILFLIVGFLVGYLLTRLRLKSALTQADAIKSLSTKLTSLENQRELDSQALTITQRQLNPFPNEQELKQEEIDEAIKNASSSTKKNIFYQAENMLWHNIDTDIEKMKRTIPIFRALIASDEENKYHKNHGRLGIALSRNGDSNWSEVKIELDKAILIRGESVDKNDLYYELYRAEGLINLDVNFNKEQKSDDNSKQAILSDIQAAFANPDIKGFYLNKYTSKDTTITRWLEINKIDPSTLQPK